MELSLVIAIFSAVAATVVVWLYQRGVRAATDEKLRLTQSQLEEARTIISQTETEKENLNRELQDHIRQVAVLDEKLKTISDLRENLRDNFKALSTEALQQSNQSFLQLATENLAKFHEGAKAEFEKREKAVDTLVEPIKKTLEQFDLKLNDLEKNRTVAYSSLTEQVRLLGEGQSRLSQETQKLATSLSTSSKVRGRWGELQLRRVVELTGMMEHCDFDLQSSFTSKDEDSFVPDMIIKLPGKQSILVDAKAPIQAYLESLEAIDEATRQSKLDEHAAQLRRQINVLGGKAYHKKFENSVGFVVLFVPGDVFFHAAMEREPDLSTLAIDKGILLASPTSLFALLYAANRGWQQEKMVANAVEISKQGSELFKRIGTYFLKLQKLERSIRQTVQSFNEAQGSLESRFVPLAREMGKQLGRDVEEELPQVPQIDIETRVVTPLLLEVEVEEQPKLS